MFVTTIAAIDGPRILILCTANQCRSPMAEALLRHLLEQRGIEAAVDSAGLHQGGVPATATAAEVLGAQGLDLSGHRSRHLADAAVDLAGADLVLTMERRHLQEAILLAPEVRPRALTLVDAVGRAEGQDARRPGEDLRSWAERLSAGRADRDLLGAGDDAVADPIGRSRRHYETTAAQLRDLLERLVDRAWPENAEPAPGSVARATIAGAGSGGGRPR